MKNVYIKYQIGINAFTRKILLKNSVSLDKQMSLSIPLITGATIYIPNNKYFTFYVGKTINLDNINLEKYKIDKYDLDMSLLADLALNGYKKACLLNYKKYDQIIIGVNDTDYIVPDYFSLKRLIEKFI